LFKESKIMFRRIRKLFRYALMFCLMLVFLVILGFAVSAAPIWGDAHLRVEVESQNGDIVRISVPLSLLPSAFKVLPRDIRRICRELQLTPEMIVDSLKDMEPGEDLVRVEGRDKVRVYVDPLSLGGAATHGFLTVYIKEGRPDGHEFTIAVPRGFISFSCTLVKLSGVVDHFCEMPQEIHHWHSVEPVEM